MDNKHKAQMIVDNLPVAVPVECYEAADGQQFDSEALVDIYHIGVSTFADTVCVSTDDGSAIAFGALFAEALRAYQGNIY